MVLRDGREALIEKILKAVVVGFDDEAPTPQVWPPMSNGLNKPYELALICSEGMVTRRDGAAEEGNRVPLLEHDGAEAISGGVALDGEHLGEVRHCEDGCRGHRI
jgi:hypothetical protein